MTISSANKGDLNAKVLLTSLIIIYQQFTACQVSHLVHSVSGESPGLQLWKRFSKYVTDSRALIFSRLRPLLENLNLVSMFLLCCCRMTQFDRGHLARYTYKVSSI